MNTTLNKLREHGPCAEGWRDLLGYLGKTAPDDEPLNIATIAKSNGLNHALWALRAVDGHNREIRLYAVWCARQVQHLMTDSRSLTALDVAEKFANSAATEFELSAAWDAAWAAAVDAAGDAAWAAAGAAARAAARADSRAAAGAAARAAAGAAAGDAAWDAARDAQLKRLLEICEDNK